MFRPDFVVASLSLLMSPLLDAAVKGTVVLLLACAVSLLLRRDSAATRHLVWATAVLPLLALPLLSITLPEWRVLPNWSRTSQDVETPGHSRPQPAARPQLVEMPGPPHPLENDTGDPGPPVQSPFTVDPRDEHRPAPSNGGPFHSGQGLFATIALQPAALMTLAWLAGCMSVLLRLLVAALLLRESASRCRVLAPPQADGASMPDSRCRGGRALRVAMDAAAARLNVKRSVQLLLDPRPSMPVVWGLLRLRMRLPADAVGWSLSQQQSVLLHELAHIRRHDLVVLRMTQLACALNWFNPLMWFAAWRLGVERERACDDLVLASGVRPSAYAEHLLEVVTGLSPARWTQSCGLAMARKSSLEGRLVAVLSENLNRRGVSLALAAIGLAAAVVVAVPLAMLRAADENWDPPRAAHIGTDDFSTYCVHDGKDVAFVIAYHGGLDSSSAHESNSRTRAWTDSGTLTAKKPGIALTFQRTHTAPVKLSLTTASADARDVGRPAPHNLGQREFDLARGRVFLLDDSGSVRQLAIASPVVRDPESANQLAALIAAIPPQARVPETQESNEPMKLPGRLFVNAGLRTTTDERRFSQGAIAIDPNTGSWTRLRNFSESTLTVPISPVRVSPDGRTMLFMRESEIWKLDAMTGENPARVYPRGRPQAWAPDGKEFIVVVEKEAGRPDRTENWRVSADGTNQTLVSLPIGDVVEDWSTDGRWLVGRSHGDGQLYIVKPDGSGRRRLTNTHKNASRDEHPRFSPDGRRIVYLRTQHQGDNNARDSRFSLRTIDFDGTNDREILGETAVEPAAAKAAWTAPMGARWSPDGTHLAVVLFDHTRDGGILAINGNWRLAILGSDGGNLRELKLKGVLNTVLPWDGPEWRPRPPAVVAREPKPGAKLQSATEERLKWGEPASGLRMALAWPPTLGEPGMGDAPRFHLVVQNVSQAAIRLTAGGSAPNPRTLMLRDNGRPLSAIRDSTPTTGDWLLQPREVVFFRLFQPGEKTKDGRTTDAVIEQDIRVFPRYSMTADMSIEKAPAGAWTGKLATGETRGSVDVVPPKHKGSQALYKTWTTAARADGKIPGGVIALLGQSVKTFIKNNPTWKTTPQLERILPRLDASRDWTGPEAVALLDELAAVQATPISMALDNEHEHTIQTGMPLPPEWAGAPWGEAHPCGLRLAFLLEPRAAEYPLNTPLKGRILIHNTGKEPVVFRTRTWHQAGHTARDAKGTDINIVSFGWTTLGRLLPFRLAPGEFVEVNTAGIGVGAKKDAQDWQDIRVGSWIDANAGDDVTVTTTPVPLSDRDEEPACGEPRWWFDDITARLARHLPFPPDAESREMLLYRVAMELFGTPVGAEINAAFVADREPTALDSLARRLARRAGLAPFTGVLRPAPTRFRALPADPDAAKRPRTASNPGWFTLGEHSRLSVTRRPEGTRIGNGASILFFSPDPSKPAPREPHEIKLPDGYNTWVAAWIRGATVLWVSQEGLLRRIDFTDPAKVEETRFEAEAVANAPIPSDIRASLRGTRTAPDGPKRVQEPAAPKPATPAPTTLKQEPQ